MDNNPSRDNPGHGTACAGIIGASKDNKTCGVGIAHEVNLGGRLLSSHKELLL